MKRRLPDPAPVEVPVVLTPQDVADLLQVPVRTVMAWRNDPRVPLRGSRLGKHVRFTAQEVNDFLAARQSGDAA